MNFESSSVKAGITDPGYNAMAVSPARLWPAAVTPGPSIFSIDPISSRDHQSRLQKAPTAAAAEWHAAWAWAEISAWVSASALK
jgi:hypothetical protein